MRAAGAAPADLWLHFHIGARAGTCYCFWEFEVTNMLQSKHQCDEGEAHLICNKVQEKLLKECHDPAKVCITDLRISHWEEAIQEIKGGEANRNLAAECYFLWKTTRLQHLTLTEETRSMLTELRKMVRLLLLTNGDKLTQREKIEACACQPYFDAIVVGGEQKEEKPAPSIFHHCCDLLGVQPQDCVMVGDSLDTDIQGGLNAGLKATVWINKTMTMPVNTYPVPHYIISSVLDLPALLQNMDHKMNANLETDKMVSINDVHDSANIESKKC
ncbi:N-acylneuraminate-9-phosphatase isoform 1-T1 [Pangshura tecta]